MVKFALQLKASLDNVEELKPGGPDFRWYFKFACSNCGVQSEKWNYVSLSDEISAQHGHDTHNFSSKCKFCSRVNTVKIIPESIKSYNDEYPDTFKTVVILDCRGIEPCEFSAREGWLAKADCNGNTFADVDLSKGEWSDYCPKSHQPVCIFDVEYIIKRIK